MHAGKRSLGVARCAGQGGMRMEEDDFMSIEREFRRRAMLAEMRANGMRST